MSEDKTGNLREQTEYSNIDSKESSIQQNFSKIHIENLKTQIIRGSILSKQHLRAQIFSLKTLTLIIFFIVIIINNITASRLELSYEIQQYAVNSNFLVEFNNESLIIYACVASFFSSYNSISKEFHNKTFPISYTLPISKTTYILSKFLVDILYAFCFLLIFNSIAAFSTYLSYSKFPNYYLVVYLTSIEILFSLFFISLMYLLQLLTKNGIVTILIIVFYQLYLPFFILDQYHIYKIDFPENNPVWMSLFLQFLASPYATLIEERFDHGNNIYFNFGWNFLIIVVVYFIIFFILIQIILKTRDVKIKN